VKLLVTDPDHELLLQREIEDDTRILAAQYFRIENIPLLVEKWSSDGVTGKSAIFLSEHVSGMNDEALRLFFNSMAQVDLPAEGTTVKRGDRFAFFNFGFEMK
jgi:hypothetical protein